jgi:hypothetical protein
MPRCAAEAPKVALITRFRYVGRKTRWATHIEFENGVLLKFTGRLADDHATAQAERYYSGMLEAGWSEDEIVAAFPNTPAQAGKVCPNCHVPFSQHKPCGSFAQAGKGVL